MYKKVTLTKNLYSPFVFGLERLEIFRRQVEPRWEGTEAVAESGARALGLKKKQYLSTTIHIVPSTCRKVMLIMPDRCINIDKYEHFDKKI